MKLFFRKSQQRQRKQTFSTMIREALEREKAEKKKASHDRGEHSLLKGLV